MGYITIIWDMDDDPEGNVQHVAAHDLTKEEVEDVLAEPEKRGVSRSSGAASRLRHDIHGSFHRRRL